PRVGLTPRARPCPPPAGQVADPAPGNGASRIHRRRASTRTGARRLCDFLERRACGGAPDHPRHTALAWTHAAAPAARLTDLRSRPGAFSRPVAEACRPLT